MGQETGGMFRREGRHVYLWLIRVEVDRKQRNSVKQLSFNKKSKRKETRSKTSALMGQTLVPLPTSRVLTMFINREWPKC